MHILLFLAESGVVLDRKFIACVLASAFLCTLPPPPHDSQVRSINFISFFACFHRYVFQVIADDVHNKTDSCVCFSVCAWHFHGAWPRRNFTNQFTLICGANIHCKTVSAERKSNSHKLPSWDVYSIILKDLATTGLILKEEYSTVDRYPSYSYSVCDSEWIGLALDWSKEKYKNWKMNHFNTAVELLYTFS